MRSRVPDWELYLARVRFFGFTVRDTHGEAIEVERDGRIGSIDLTNTVRYGGNDPRDLWLLSLALEDGAQWAARETYFVLSLSENEPSPVDIVLGRHSDAAQTPFLRHGSMSDDCEMITLRSGDDLLDALPFLAPSNAVGYHRARARIIVRYEAMRPRAWEDVSVDDPGIIAEYERYGVTPDNVAEARANGRDTVHQIIACYGIPVDDEWTEVDGIV